MTDIGIHTDRNPITEAYGEIGPLGDTWLSVSFKDGTELTIWGKREQFAAFRAIAELLAPKLASNVVRLRTARLEAEEDMTI